MHDLAQSGPGASRTRAAALSHADLTGFGEGDGVESVVSNGKDKTQAREESPEGCGGAGNSPAVGQQPAKQGRTGGGHEVIAQREGGSPG